MVEVRCVAGPDLDESLKLLEKFIRDGERAPPDFAGLFRKELEIGNIEVLTAYLGGSALGVAVLAFRPSVSVGGCFVSVEELYVEPEARRRGVGRALLDAVEERCVSRGVSYIEVQATEEDAVAFYRALGYEVESDVRVLSRSVSLGRSAIEVSP